MTILLSPKWQLLSLVLIQGVMKALRRLFSVGRPNVSWIDTIKTVWVEHRLETQFLQIDAQ